VWNRPQGSKRAPRRPARLWSYAGSFVTSPWQSSFGRASAGKPLFDEGSFVCGRDLVVTCRRGWTGGRQGAPPRLKLLVAGVSRL